MNRLIDLHNDWLLQYVAETTLFDPALYPRQAARLTQADGFLQSTSAAFLSCYRKPEDWATQTDPWHSLGELIARVEAEFSGRLIQDRHDLARWRADEDGLAWGVLAVEGFDALIRTEADLDHLPALYRRGVRVFQPVFGATSQLAGSSQEGDDRGLLDLGRDFLDRLSQLSEREPHALPIVDLAHLNQAATSEVLDWFEAEPSRIRRLLPLYSHGAVEHPGFQSPRALSAENLIRLRALGGVVGLCGARPFYQSATELRFAIEQIAEVPFLGRPGYEGIAIGTDFLGVDETNSGLGNAPEVVAWLKATFPAATAAQLRFGTANKLIERMIDQEGLERRGW